MSHSPLPAVGRPGTRRNHNPSRAAARGRPDNSYACLRQRASSRSSPPISSAASESRRLVDPHQRGMDGEALVEAEAERDLHGLDGVVAAVGITGIIGLAHAGDDVAGGAPIGERAGEGKEDQIAAGHEGGGQAAVGDLDGRFAGERRIGNGGKRVELDHVVVTDPRFPFGVERGQAFADARANVELDPVTLAVVEADGFHARETLQRPGEAHGRVLSAGKQHERCIGAQTDAHPFNPTAATRSNRRCGRRGARARRSPSSRRRTV